MAQASLGTQIRDLLALVGSLVSTRLDLARLEIAEWWGQVGRVLVFAVLALITGFFSLITLVIAVLIQCWDTCREVAAWSLFASFGLALLMSLIGLSLALKRSRRFLPMTRDVLREDLESLKHE
jgi:uncharacterized membrane protein YqjE